MLSDPRSLAVSPYPSNNAQASAQSRFGGTVAMDSRSIEGRGAKGPAIDVPVVNDTSSEGVGDHVATIAMPMRNVAAVLAGAVSPRATQGGVPRMHDDPSSQGQMGTQLMSHASLRQAGVPMPQAQSHRASSGQLPHLQPQGVQQSPQLTPVPGGQYQGSMPINPGQQQAQGQQAHRSAEAQGQQSAGPGPQSGEGADLTTVYRREKTGTTGPEPRPQGRGGRSIGMILGVIAFALVGFAIAAIVLRYAQTGYFPWQTPAP